MLVCVMLKPGDAVNEPPANLLGYAAQHARNVLGEGVFSAAPDGVSYVGGHGE